MRKNGFTLVELLAVIVIIAIILAIAVPAIGGLIESARRGSFESDAKMIIKAVEYKLLQDNDFDVLNIKKDLETGEDTVSSILKLSTDNYNEVSVYKDELNKINVLVIGQNKWENLVVYGTSLNMTVDDSSDYEGGYICAGTIGDAQPNEVLTGKIFTNDSGTQTGTMPIRNGSVAAQGISRNGSTLKFQPQTGYYDGSNGNTVDYTDSDFIASNIKQGIDIFGITGTLTSAVDINNPIHQQDISAGHSYSDSEGSTTNYLDLPYGCKIFAFTGELMTKTGERSGYHDQPGESNITAYIDMTFIATGATIRLLYNHVDHDVTSYGYRHGLTLLQGTDDSLLFISIQSGYYGGATPILTTYPASNNYDMSEGLKFKFYSYGDGGAVDRAAQMTGKAIMY